jgi:phosphotransacetylase
MANISSAVKNRLNAIVVKDYEECQFFFAAAHLLQDHLKKIYELAQKEEIDLALMRDTIGELGLYISNLERGLNEVEECYTKLVEALE